MIEREAGFGSVDPQLVFRLILARAPDKRESSAALVARSDELACDLLVSHEFQVSTAEPVLDGCYVDRRERFDRREQAEIEAAFGLAAGVRLRRLALLARVVESEALRSSLASAQVSWSAAGLALALRRAARRSGVPLPDVGGGSPFHRIARNVSVVAVSGLEACQDPDAIRLDGGLRFVMFKLDPGLCAEQDYCRIDFGLSLERPPARMSLALDYGGGFQQRHVVELLPRGRSRFAAYLADPRSVAMIRWDLEPACAAIPTVLTARAWTKDSIAHVVRWVAGERALGWLEGSTLPTLRPAAPEISAFRQSEWLTSALGGHRGDRADYADWLRLRSLVFRDRAVPVRVLGAYPSFDLILFIRKETASAVSDTVAAVRRQSYVQWSLLIVFLGDASAAGRASRWIEDERVSVLSGNHGRTEGDVSSAVLRRCKGDWLGTLCPGELLASEALERVASFVEKRPRLRFVYADHDHLGHDGQRRDPAFKPEFSPETLLGYDYIAKPSFMRPSDLRSVGGWRDVAGSRADYDLKLRVLDLLRPEGIGHLAEVLLHMPYLDSAAHGGRETSGSAAKHIVQERLALRGIDADIEEVVPSGLRIRPALPSDVLVTLIVPTRDRADLLKMCIGSILRHAARARFEIVVVDNGSCEPETLALFDGWRDDPRLRVIEYDRPFNFSAINNFAVTHARGDVVGFLNNDVEAVASGWMEALAGWALQREIGCVGAKLLYPNGRIQHGGVIVGIGAVAAHSHKYYPRGSAGYGNRLALVHNVSAVTAACLFVRRRTFEAVGGFEERLAVAYNDVDFCLKVLDAGYRNLMCPFAELIHHESSSRGADDVAEKSARFQQEIAFMREKWGSRLRLDPFYSPNLTQAHEDFGFNWSLKDVGGRHA